MKLSELERVIDEAYNNEWEELCAKMDKLESNLGIDNTQRLVYLMTTISCKLTALSALLSLLFVEIEQDEEE